MKKLILSLIISTLFIISAKAQIYCDTYFSAYSIEVGVKCKYCNEKRTFILPEKIKFNRTLVCESFKNPLNTTTEGKCKLSTILHYITSMYWNTWAESNSFASQKCLGIENPNYTHKAYEFDPIDVGIKDYEIEKEKLESLMKDMDDYKYSMDDLSYQAGRKASAKYSIKVLTNSCY